MKFEIDESVCRKKHLSLPQVLILLAVRMDDYSSNLQDLYDKKAIIQEFGKPVITQPWSDKVDEILCDSTQIVDMEKWYEALAKDFAKTFPQGKMANTPYYYRCNTRELVLKFKKFFSLYPEYTPSEEMKERIIKASKRYNLEKDRDPRYRVLSKYFILKNKMVSDEDGSNHIEEVSPLASYLENEGQEEVEQDDWLFNTRN